MAKQQLNSMDITVSRYMTDASYNVLREAEDGFIGYLLRWPEKNLPIALGKISLDDIYFSDTRIAYDVILQMYRERLEINSLTAAEFTCARGIDKRNELQPNVGLYFSDRVFGEFGGTRPSFDFYVKRMSEMAQHRNAMRALTTIYMTLGQYDITTGEALNKSYAELTKIMRDEVDDDPAKVRLAAIEAMYEKNFEETGLEPFDRLITGGFWKGNLYILAARPSMGKTTFAINLILRMCERKKKVLFFSYEVSPSVVYYKIAGMKAGLNFIEVRKDMIADRRTEAESRFIDAFADIEYDMWIRDERDLDDMCAVSMEKACHEDGIDLIVVDHINLMTVKGITNMTECMTAVSGRLKELARKMKVPVLALSQLNRDVTKRNDKRPMLNDLRGSGSIEQDADVVIFLHRESYYDQELPDERMNDIEVRVSKQRDGETGAAIFTFDRNTGRIGINSNSPANVLGNGRPLSRKATDEIADMFD